jgi:virginiamycin B lyase
MNPALTGLLLASSLFLAAPGLRAGGSHYGTPAGSAAGFKGTVSEWPVPTPEFARDPAIAPDGSIFIAVMHGNKIAHFDPATRKFTEWDLPPSARPHGLLVDRQGIVWYTGNGNGTIGRLDPATGRVTEFKAPSGGDPHTLVTDGRGVIWFTVQSAGRVGRLDTASGRITEFAAPGGPYGLALDRAGNVWVCLMGGNQLGRIDAKSGEVSRVDMPSGARPRRMAAAPDGSLWVTFNGTNKLAQFDPGARRLLREIPLPSGSGGGAYAVTVDGAGIVWVNEIRSDTVVRFDPGTGESKVVKLPSRNVGIRKMVVDAQGRLWYMGSHNGRLGMVE